MSSVTVNGVDRDLRPGATVEDLVAEISPDSSGVAAALNGTVVVRVDWPRTRLVPGDRVEILSASPGG